MRRPVTATNTSPAASDFDEASARRVLLVRSCDARPADHPLWTADDRAWATRLAIETTPAAAPDARFLAARAQHALQRLAPRDPSIARLLGRPLWRAAWVGAALAAALLAGAVLDSLGGSQRINLLAPPVWAVIVWNGVVYLALLLQVLGLWPAVRGVRGLRSLIQRWMAGRAAPSPLQAFALDWARVAAPLALARAALLLHAAAAALALGLVAGLYLRGLVLDYRAGWQSTFLVADTVRAVLAALLAPASALTGITVPDAATLATMRVLPGAAATASAAPWIHLYATLLALVVIVPRVLLALAAAWRARRLARHVVLPLDEPYFQRLLRERSGRPAQVQVLPYAAAPSPQAVLGLRAVLAPTLGDSVTLQFAALTAFGDEDDAAQIAAESGTSLRVALFDFTATPEAEQQGRFVAALQGRAAVLVVADEAAFRRRFGTLPARLTERRAAWKRFADACGVALLCADLDQPDVAAATRALAMTLSR